MISNEERARLLKVARIMMARGDNIVQGLTQDENASRTIAIEIAYALHSGSYTEYAKTETARLSRVEGHEIIEPLLAQYRCRTLLDCGAGEGTRWLDSKAVLEELALLEGSWARLTYAEAILTQVPSISSYQRIKGNMMAIPFVPGSFDVVFTSHSLEPNTDEDAAHIISSLFSLARKLVILFEPNYRDAHPEMKSRMEFHGYARNIWEVAEAQAGFTCIANGDFKNNPNPDNRTSYIVMRRDSPLPYSPAQLKAPAGSALLFETTDGYQCEDGSFAYPVLGGIACLAPEDGVFLGTRPRVNG